MCGRYTLSADAGSLWQELDLEGTPADLEGMPPRYNIAPTQQVPVVVDRAPRKLVALRWGLVPFWAKDPSIGSRMINARAESVADKPAFKRLFASRRCLVAADGFYEWRRDGEGKKPKKTPVHIRLASGRPFTFAGLWDAWKQPDGTPLRTFTIITTRASASIAHIHDRMPVIVSPDDRRRWLDREADPEDLHGLLGPHPPEELVHWEVSTVVNAPANDVPECIEPVTEEPPNDR